MLGPDEVAAGEAIVREMASGLAERMGVADTYHPTPVGVWFGEPGEPIYSEITAPVTYAACAAWIALFAAIVAYRYQRLEVTR